MILIICQFMLDFAIFSMHSVNNLKNKMIKYLLESILEEIIRALLIEKALFHLSITDKLSVLDQVYLPAKIKEYLLSVDEKNFLQDLRELIYTLKNDDQQLILTHNELIAATRSYLMEDFVTLIDGDEQTINQPSQSIKPEILLKILATEQIKLIKTTLTFLRDTGGFTEIIFQHALQFTPDIKESIRKFIRQYYSDAVVIFRFQGEAADFLISINGKEADYTWIRNLKEHLSRNFSQAV